MSCVDLAYISNEECIGNSLSSINGNFAALSAAVCELSANVPDATVNVFDSPTIDLDWNASTRTLSAVTTSMVATSSSPMVAKAWVNFNGTTSPGTIRSSYNVSSVTKNGTGDYTVNFTAALADANYSIVGIGNGTTPYAGVVEPQTLLTTSVNIFLYQTVAGSQQDGSIVSITIFGN